MKKFYLIIFLVLLTSGAFFVFKNQKEPLPVPQEAPANTNTNTEITGNTNSENTNKNTNASPTPPIKDSYDLKVPFVSQAPYANWDELHNEACEEEAIILVHFYKKRAALSKETAENEIQKMVSYEIKNYGSHKDLTAQETAKLAKDFYGYKNVKIKYDFSWDDVKREISAGNPVIVPTAGRLLGNPNFRRPGPLYHMLVLRGYTKDIVITNDIGTRKGERYQYSYKTLDRAIHDWTGNPDTISQGRRAMIVIN